MFEGILTALQQVPVWIWLGLGALVLCSILFSYRHYVAFQWLRFWCNVPLIGLVARLSRDAQTASGPEWTRAERVLCAAFARFAPEPAAVNRFDKAMIYLQRVGEVGRAELHWSGWVVLAVLLLLEAASFGLLLSDFLNETLPIRYKVWVGYSIGGVMAATLLALTHASGRQLYLNGLIRKARDWYLHRRIEEQEFTLRPIQDVSLDNPSADDNQPPYIQLISRVGYSGAFKPSYWMITFTLALVIGIGITGYMIRSASHEKASYQTATASEITNTAGAFQFQEPFSSSISKPEVLAPDRAGATATFIAVSLLYLGLQALGVIVGFGHSFAGNETKAALKLLEGFSCRDDFLEWHRDRRSYVCDLAQSHVERLQRELLKMGNGIHSSHFNSRTFREYLLQSRELRSAEEAQLTRHLQATSPGANGKSPNLAVLTVNAQQSGAKS